MKYRSSISALLLIAPCVLGAGNNSSASSKRVRLRIFDSYESLNIVIENDEEDGVVISRNLSLSPVVGALKLSIEKDGKDLALSAQTEPVLTKETDYIHLRPGEVFGAVFDKKMIRDFYQTGAGCIIVEATYHDPGAKLFKAFEGTIASNAIRVCD